MALWQNLAQLPTSVIDSLRVTYGDHFPLEIRQYLSDWLIMRVRLYVMNEVDIQSEATSFFNDLLTQINSTALSLSYNENGLKNLLLDSENNLRLLYSHDPVQLYCHLQNCFQYEQQLLNNPNQGIPNNGNETSQVLENIAFQVRTIDNENWSLRKEYDEFCVKYNESTGVIAQYEELVNLNLELRENANYYIQQENEMIQNLSNNLRTSSQNMVEKFKNTIAQITTIQKNSIDIHLREWIINQKYIANGASIQSPITLDLIQGWFESLANTLIKLHEQLKNLKDSFQKFTLLENTSIECLPKLTQSVEYLLENLVNNSFVIARQPPQVIMKNRKFSTTIRFLTGNTLSSNVIQSSVKITSETQMQKILTTGRTESYGEILNAQSTIEYNETTKHLSLTFSNILINTTIMDKMRERRRRNPTEKVVDKKFALLFESTIRIRDSELTYYASTFSLPVVIIVHVSQEPEAFATIFWDNAFSEYNRTLFSVPEKVPWNRFSEALNTIFFSATGRYLTNENLHFIFEKILRANVPLAVDDRYEVTWTYFTKDNLPNRSFTFWEWFYEIMKLTKNYFKEIWSEGLIIGFINRNNAEQCLTYCQSGTFLLRFSETELGSITISVIGANRQNFHYQPFSANDLQIRSLANTIGDLVCLTHLYPDQDKYEAFGRYMTSRQETRNHYVPRYFRYYDDSH